jgi:hypothetical protein
VTTPANDSTPLLAYSIRTSPYPVQASASDTTAYCDLTIMASYPKSKVPCAVSKLGLALPVRGAADSATDLAAVAPGTPTVKFGNPDAPGGADGGAGWRVTDNGNGAFVIEPASGKPVVFTHQSIVITVARLQVSDQVGNAAITVTEWSAPCPADSTAPKTTSRRMTVITVPKFPPSFELSELKASALLVDCGETVTLTWNGSPGATYTLGYDHHGDSGRVTESAEVHPAAGKSYGWRSPPLLEKTVFKLTVSATKNEQSVDASQSESVDVDLDLKASAPQVDCGVPVTLTWNGSPGADYQISYGQEGSSAGSSAQVKPATGNSCMWTSPPLQKRSWFTLTISALQGQSKVNRKETLWVDVSVPRITSASVYPSPVDRGQPTRLQWSSENADKDNGVHLIPPSGPDVLYPANPDPSKPYWLAPQPGRYFLRAYRNKIPSDPFELLIRFYAVRVESCNVWMRQDGGNLAVNFILVVHNAKNVWVRINALPNDPGYRLPTPKTSQPNNEDLADNVNLYSSPQGQAVFSSDWSKTIVLNNFTIGDGRIYNQQNPQAAFRVNFYLYAEDYTEGASLITQPWCAFWTGPAVTRSALPGW